jgi:hypothetical protein
MAPAESAGSGGERHENFTLPRSHEVTDVIRDRLLALACDPRSHRSGRKPFRVDLELVSFGPVRRNPPTAAARLRAGMMKSPTRSEHLYPDLESVLVLESTVATRLTHPTHASESPRMNRWWNDDALPNETSRGFLWEALASSGRRVSTRSTGLSFRGLLTDRAPAGSPVTGLLMGCRARFGVST